MQRSSTIRFSLFLMSFHLQGLPVHFCKASLPKNDGVITLVDEDGEEFPTIYLARKTGLSGGWKGFSVAHELTDGDAVVFQLIKPTTMKVVMMRLYLRLESQFSCFLAFLSQSS